MFRDVHSVRRPAFRVELGVWSFSGAWSLELGVFLMNRSILIVICDFLLVSLLAFSTVDINKATDPNAARNVNVTMQRGEADTNSDLTAVMRLALEEERKRREQIVSELTQAQATTSQRDTQ